MKASRPVGLLRSILWLPIPHCRQHTLPDFTALRATLFCVDEFPEQRHLDHASGERNIRDLEHAAER